MSLSRIGVGAALVALSCGTALAAPTAYSVDLGPAARTNATRLTAVGKGRAEAVLDGGKLTITGKFGGLVSPATMARLCVGIGIGMPGTCGPELTVSRDLSGTLSGTIILTARQKAALPAGQLYIQIDSVKAPAPSGNLWGWLLAAHAEVPAGEAQQGHWFLPQYDMPQSVEHGSTNQTPGRES